MGSHVYINNQEVELMEDRRLCLYPRYPEGTVLVDPTYYPPRPVPLCTNADEFGVTARKLLPNGHYHAFTLDPVTGERVPVHVPQKYLIVHNLPPNATAEFVGKYFEQFDFIVEGDIIKVPANQPHAGSCKGRGYIQFSNPDTVKNILAQYKTLVLMPNVTVWLDSSDQKPKTYAVPPPQYNQHHTGGGAGVGATGSGGPSSNGAAVNSAQSYVDTRVGHMHHHSSSSRHHHGGPAIPPPAPAAVATCTNNYYFVTHIYEEHIETSIRDGIFWPTKLNQRSFYTALERGPVYLIFLLMQRAALFGYARLTPRDMIRNKHANFTLEWVKHSVYVREDELNAAFPSVQVLHFSDGTPLKPELGQAVCEFIDGMPVFKGKPTDLPYVNTPPSANSPPAPRSAASPNSNSSSNTNNSSGAAVVPQPRSAQQSPTSYGGPQLPAQQQPASQSVSSPTASSPYAHHHHHHLHHHHHHHHMAHHHLHHHHHHMQHRAPMTPPSAVSPGTPPPRGVNSSSYSAANGNVAPPPPPAMGSSPMRGNGGPGQGGLPMRGAQPMFMGGGR